jgi:hypothetical protein
MSNLAGLVVLAVFAILWIPFIMRAEKFGAPFVPMKT